MLYYLDSDKLIFGSEMKALLAFGIPKKIDTISLYTYLQLNYIPGPATIFENVYKMVPGTYLLIKNGIVRKKKYYRIPEQTSVTMNISYEDAGKKLMELLDAAVQRRLVADVPLGAFLSGGIDSSVIAALAARHSPFINTFSIGYKDEPYFDETHYADLVAKKLNTDHTVFSLTNDDLFENLFKVLDYTDEPFADSSALAVHILSMYTRKKVTVALSGDGADEMFAGYNKHYAHFKARKSGLSAGMIKAGEAIWKRIPQSRNSGIGNKARQLNRFAQGLRLSEKERYWNWCAFTDETTSRELFAGRLDETEYLKRKNKLLGSIGTGDGICDILYTDMHLVLQNDMLTKVDMMSMANSLEVRTPFLDHEVVDFVFSLPEKYKINAGIRKRILQDTFREVLPDELYKRPKQGFEVPLIKWLRTDLRTLITDDLLKESTIREQGLFDPTEIKRMIAKLFSSNPEDIHARIWGLIVFQYWWKKYFL
ncbi:MAG: asparagine synthase (glutamine-hydrolyzing), partial [Bacteroidetes bacterium]|nr:asparagine synthase (glutamine-hydrolyzing) [Bacteroidota bacterium]